ncbi:MAG: hypothetical protein LBH90_01250 [Tannerella sp.]|jgi:hypothetical protein|nr:hypothetical protein [Tannerella sp.]
MDRKTIHQVIGVYLLSGIFLLPFIVKSIHIYADQSYDKLYAGSGHSSGKTHHDCNSCPVCLFTYSTFTASDPLSLTVHPVFADHTKAIVITKTYYADTFSTHFLRGPPEA